MRTTYNHLLVLVTLVLTLQMFSCAPVDGIQDNKDMTRRAAEVPSEAQHQTESNPEANHANNDNKQKVHVAQKDGKKDKLKSRTFIPYGAYPGVGLGVGASVGVGVGAGGYGRGGYGPVGYGRPGYGYPY